MHISNSNFHSVCDGQVTRAILAADSEICFEHVLASGWHQSTFPALQLQLQDSTIAATKAIFCQLSLDCKVSSFEYCQSNFVAPHCNALAPRSKAERPFLSSCPHKQGSTFQILQILHQLGCFGCHQLTCRPAKNRQEPRHPASIEKISKSKRFLQGSNLKIL